MKYLERTRMYRTIYTVFKFRDRLEMGLIKSPNPNIVLLNSLLDYEGGICFTVEQIMDDILPFKGFQLQGKDTSIDRSG